MKRMTVDELYEYLCSPLFLDEKSGNIFYNYYIYQYPASQEYEMRRQIQEFKQKLERPTNFVNALVLDLFRVFCEYLQNEKFGDTSLLEDTFEGDRLHPDMVTTELTSEANSDNFIRFVRDKIEAHMALNDGYNKPYVFIHGIGKMFPYLRTNVFSPGTRNTMIPRGIRLSSSIRDIRREIPSVCSTYWRIPIPTVPSY